MKKKINTERTFSTLSTPSGLASPQSTMYETKKSFRKSLDSLKNNNTKNKIRKALVTNSDFAKNYGLKTAEDLRDFEKMQSKIKEEYDELHDDNQHFYKYYQKIEELREVAEKKKLDKVNRIESTFMGLINKYRERGYKIPNLSVKNNLFAHSPLLMENSKLNEFYKFLTIEEIENNKDQVFIDKLQTLVTEKQSEKPEETKNVYSRRMTNVGMARKLSILRYLHPTEPDIEAENHTLKKENAKKKAMVNEFAQKVHLAEKLLTGNNRTSSSQITKKLSSKLIPSLNINSITNSLGGLKAESSGRKDNLINKGRGSFLKNKESSRNNKINSEFDFSPNAFLVRSNKSRNVDNMIRRSIFKLNDEKTPFKTRTVDKMSNLETAGNTDRSKKSKHTVCNNSSNFHSSTKKDLNKKVIFHNKTRSNESVKSGFYMGKNTPIEKTNELQYFQTLPSIDYSRTSADFKADDNKDNITGMKANIDPEGGMTENTEKLIQELYENKKLFLDYLVEKMEIDQMSVNDLKDIVIDYYVTFLGYKESEAEDTVGRYNIINILI